MANGSTGAETDAPTTADSRISPTSADAQAEGRPIYGGPPGQQLDEDPQANNDRGLDAEYVLSALIDNNSLRALVHGRPGTQYITNLRDRLRSNDLIWSDVENIESIIENQEIVWGCNLPTERNRRRRERGEDVAFVPDALELLPADRATVHHVEVMAECFMQSARVRSMSRLSGPENLQMLYRLQRGSRTAPDRLTLSEMLRNNAAVRTAMETQMERSNRRADSSERDQRRRALDDERRASARQGDHSRAELNVQRQAAERVAIAAGSIAMRTGARTLFERMAYRAEESRSVLERLQEIERREHSTLPGNRTTTRNFNASPSATDSDADSDGEAVGLDAKNTGRPEEPLSDEAMTMKLDCRICYTQLADTACLPCGHLSMCRWCSEQHSPTMAHDKTRPRQAAACPVCRKGIRQKVRIFRA